MKYVIKNPEPHELLSWKESDKMYLGGNPKWERIPPHIKNLVRAALMIEQGYICCYCERSIQEGDCHIEHIKPKATAGYKSFLADYDNLLCSCQLEIPKGDPRHCGMGKKDWYEEKLFISPLHPDCEARFKYTHDGYIHPATANDTAASTTIEQLHLRIDKLNALRRAAIDPFLDESLSEDELNSFVTGYLVSKSDNQGRLNQFYTTIKYLFSNQ